jgi:flagellin
MGLIINHNLMAMNAARSLNVSYSRLATSVQRLSSGLRVNSAQDDAAGLAVREIMRTDIRVINQGVRNANDAISLIQTADGAFSVIDEKLTRMKELAEQAATGTYTTAQRLIMDSEYQAMASEITRIAMATDFNGVKLLDGSLSGTGVEATAGNQMKIHFGTGNSSAEDYYYIRINEITASSMGVGNSAALGAGYTISTQSAAQMALEAIDSAVNLKDTIRANLGGIANRLANTISNMSIQAENLQSAESRISDVDVASEMTEFTRNQILVQAGVAMLAQANSLPQLALKLMGA